MAVLAMVSLVAALSFATRAARSAAAANVHSAGNGQSGGNVSADADRAQSTNAQATKSQTTNGQAGVTRSSALASTGRRPALTAPSRLVRVGLATDLDSVNLCCDARLTMAAGKRSLQLDRGVDVRPDRSVRSNAVYRLQVAALKDERQANDLARRLTRETGQPADAVFDADRDLYRIRVGRYRDPQEAERERGRLAALGIDQSWLVNEGGTLERSAFDVEQGSTRLRVFGRWLSIDAPQDVGIPFGDSRYRGRLLVFLNDRGLLNVINELSVEDYLRGVVPREMGPELYNELEALKAQSVAARTFTLRNLGEFASEGYDICSTPRCQVYGGMGVEHPVSDRAIAETAGEVVLVDQQPAEIFYSATCGGHTENVQVVFPAKRGEHLRGVPCFEAGAKTLAITGLPADQARRPLASLLIDALLPPPPGRGEQVLSARLEHLSLLARLPPPRTQLGSLARGEVHRFLAGFLDLALDPRLLGDGERLAALTAAPPSDWRAGDLRLARHLASMLTSAPADHDLSTIEGDTLLFELTLYLGIIESQSVGYLRHDRDALYVQHRGEQERIELPRRLVAGKGSTALMTLGNLELVPGDPLELLRHRGELLAIVQPALEPPLDLGSRAELARWQRTRTHAEVKRSVQARYPGFPFTDFQVLARGVSGRVSSLRLLGDGGRTLLVDGLAVRWTLDLPDTWFTAAPTGRNGWVFTGHGWGHGVGMCQAGSFGMAARGAGYRRILEHYFTGIEIGPVTTAMTSEPLPTVSTR